MNDVCLIVEGTYPYVAGGVSTWVHQLITNLPNINFSIVHISAKKDIMRLAKYPLPANVKKIYEIPIHDYSLHSSSFTKSSPQTWQPLIQQFHELLRTSPSVAFDTITPLFTSANAHPAVSLEEMVFSQKSWDMLISHCRHSGESQSFIDYFWTWRFTHLPLFTLLTYRLPKASLYHSVSTGYAGLCGVLAKCSYKAPLLLTEHGIYSKERKIEIQNSDWIYQDTQLSSPEKQDYLKNMWIRMFDFLGRLTYQYSDCIISLHEANKKLQIESGAREEKIRIIPNGLPIDNYKKFAELRKQKKPHAIKTIALIGRVVPIKDIKTFIRSIKIIKEHINPISALILGPYDEDREYYEECLQLTAILDLNDTVTFTGHVKVTDYLPIIDVVVLSSISESQPLVLLEANCVGIPVVATDVGACKELIQGRLPHDQALGHSGYIVPIANPQAMGQAVTSLLTHDETRIAMGEVGIQRVEHFYKQDLLIAEYATIYANLTL